MLQMIFNKMLMASLAGGVVGLVTLVLSRTLSRFFGNKWSYYIFIVPILLMLLPFSFEPLVEAPALPPILPTLGQITVEPPVVAVANVPMDNITPKANPPVIHWRFIMQSLSTLWITLVILIGFYKSIQRLKFARELKRITLPPTTELLSLLNSKEIAVKMFLGSGTPFIVGIFRPTIYVPQCELLESQLTLVLKHELTHIRRHDLLYKQLVDFVATVHFFNPVVYLLRRNIHRLCELSCDEAVAKSMEQSERKNYAKVILSLIKQNNMNPESSLALCESEKNIKKRLEIIMNTSKRSPITVVSGALVACVLIVGGVVFANTVNRQEPLTENAPQAYDEASFSIINMAENSPAPNAILAEQAAEIGTKALLEIFSADLNGKIIKMFYSSIPGRARDYWYGQVEESDQTTEFKRPPFTFTVAADNGELNGLSNNSALEHSEGQETFPFNGKTDKEKWEQNAGEFLEIAKDYGEKYFGAKVVSTKFKDLSAVVKYDPAMTGKSPDEDFVAEAYSVFIVALLTDETGRKCEISVSTATGDVSFINTIRLDEADLPGLG